MQFKVDYHISDSGVVVVEANNNEEAEDKVREMFTDGDLEVFPCDTGEIEIDGSVKV